MVNPKDLPLIISSLQLLALREILQSPDFKSKNSEELDWLIRCIDKTVKVDNISKELFGGIAEQYGAYMERHGESN